MMLYYSRLTDAYLTSSWETTWNPRFIRWLHTHRYLLAFLVLASSIADLLLTQSILSLVEEITGASVGEANALMAPIVMTWWAWPIRVGIPLLIVVRDLHKRNYSLMFTGVLLYGAVVAWNTHMYFLVRGKV